MLGGSGVLLVHGPARGAVDGILLFEGAHGLFFKDWVGLYRFELGLEVHVRGGVAAAAGVRHVVPAVRGFGAGVAPFVC